MKDMVISLIRSVFSFLDSMIAWVIDKIYELIMLIADTNIFGTDAIKVFSRRIYVLLSIFMLFKISFSLITYLINPDNFHSKEKGYGKIINNTIIVLFLIIITPLAFKELYHVQGLLIKNDTIGKIILGVGNADVSNRPQISFPVFSAFLTPNVDTDKIDMKPCENMYTAGQISSECFGAVHGHGGSDAEEALALAFGNPKNTSKLLSNDLILAKDNGEFLFDYKWLISTLTGAAVAWLLLIVAIDIAIRSVKLGFLQLIAPIPIISYLSPDSSKDGMFKKWLKVTLKTFADLFIRLAAIFFAVLIISLVASNKSEFMTIEDSVGKHPFVVIFIIIGSLMFANQLPKLIEELIPGMNLGEGFSLNPMKKIGASPLASGLVGAGVGAVGGALGGFAANRALGRGVGRSLVGGAGGIFGGSFRGGRAGLTGGGKGSPIQLGKVGAAGVGSKVLQHDGTTIGSRLRAKGQSALGISTDADVQDDIVKQYSDFATLEKAIDDRAEKEVLKNPMRDVTYSWTDADGNQQQDFASNIGVLKNNVDSLKASGTASAVDIANAESRYRSALRQSKKDYVNTSMMNSSQVREFAKNKVLANDRKSIKFKYTDHAGNQVSRTANLKTLKDNMTVRGASAEQIADAKAAYASALEKATDDYVKNNIKQDAIIRTNMETANKMVVEDRNSAFTEIKSETGIDRITSLSDLKSVNSSIETAKLELETSDAWDRAHASRDLTKKSGDK